MRAANGAIIRLYCDGGDLRVGDALQTATGRTYGILELRRQERGKHPGRQRLVVVVNPELEPGTRVVELQWHRRRRRGAR